MPALQKKKKEKKQKKIEKGWKRKSRRVQKFNRRERTGNWGKTSMNAQGSKTPLSLSMHRLKLRSNPKKITFCMTHKKPP